MAIFQGARIRSVALPVADAGRRGRSAIPTPALTRPRIRPAGVLLAAILTMTMLGLVYLTQALTSNAASAELRSIAAKRAEVLSDLQTVGAAVVLYAGSDKIAARAAKLGLDELDDPRTLRAP